LQIKTFPLEKQQVIYKDLGRIGYKEAWEYQENLLQQAVAKKSEARKIDPGYLPAQLDTQHFFLLCEHEPVYTLGKSGHMKNVLLTEAQLKEKGISFFNTNRGGDITFHGPQQIVGYPILDLEKFYTDIGKYLRNMEEAIILTIAEYGIKGERSAGETGVWIDAGIKGQERKIAAIGVRCSRWVTMHGFALNVNTDLDYFSYIIPCGIVDKQVTSIKKEVGYEVDMEDVKKKLIKNFEIVFQMEMIN
jgi:lipoyl(octanoyl) transferase